MNRVILHIDFNSFFATIEQQANPRLRGKPIAVTGGDKNPYNGTLPSPNGERRMERTVVGAASIEAKKLGIKTGMSLMEALKIYPNLVLVKGDSDKYLSCTKKFLNILKDYTLLVEVFSIDEAFIELSINSEHEARNNTPNFQRKLSKQIQNRNVSNINNLNFNNCFDFRISDFDINYAISLAQEIKQRVKAEVGEWVTCSIGISFNKRMAKLAGSMYKPDGLVIIADEESARLILDRTPLDGICGIGFRIKKRLNSMGIFNFPDLRRVPLENLLASFKSYGKILYDMARGIDKTPLVPFYEKEEVKSIGHRHTTSKDIDDPLKIKQLLFKLSELIGRKLRSKNLVGKTVTVWFRYSNFSGGGMQTTIKLTDDGEDIFDVGWKIFLNMWNEEPIRMIGISISNLSSKLPTNLSFLEEDIKREKIINTLDKVNDKYGEFTLFRGVLLNSRKVWRKPTAFLADYRFKIG